VAAATAATVLVLLALPGSEPAPPTLAQAAALAARAPTRAALPGGDAAWGLAYPDLEQLGWRDAGARVDRVGDRDARTVYYHDDGRRIAYTILASGPVRVPDGARTWRRRGKRWYGFEHDGRTVVAWERHGHMCVVSANGLGGRPLVRLISR
jgi:hypothetical protein